jgi:ATP-dependent DNA ligase
VPTGDGGPHHELKHDGFRIVAYKDGNRVHLWSRRGTGRSSSLRSPPAVKALPFAKIVLDGEAVARCPGEMAPPLNQRKRAALFTYVKRGGRDAAA